MASLPGGQEKQMQTLSIKTMQKEDLEDIINIESKVFPDPWTYTMFADQVNLPDLYKLITIRLDDEIVGYGGLLIIRDEGHITNLAVKLERHSQGIGKAIVYFLFNLALEAGIKAISLEVRTTNLIAQELYKKFGFKNIAIRKNYYGYEDDAFIMSIEQLNAPNTQKDLQEIRNSLKYQFEECAA